MKFLAVLVKSSLRTCSTLIQNHRLINCSNPYIFNLSTNHRNFCSPAKKQNLTHTLIPKFDAFLIKEEEYQTIRDALDDWDSNEPEERFKVLGKMMDLYFKRESEFGDLSDDVVQLLKQDYEKMRMKKLLPPKRLTSEMISDMLRIIDNEKSRLHLLAFYGMKQMNKFKQCCNRQLDFTSKRKFPRDKKPDEQVEVENSIYRINSRVNHFMHMKLWNAVLEGQNVVLDFSFSSGCLKSEQNGVVSQAHRIVKYNLTADKPFNVWFTSLSMESAVGMKMDALRTFAPTNFINRTEQHFTELFPKERLIYMSPDAEEEFDEFDRNAVYVLGAIVDRYEDEPLSKESAKKHNIRSVRLPIEKHVITSDLSLDLSFLSVFKMLNFMQYEYATWDKAFKMHLSPDRRISDMELIEKFNPNLRLWSEKEIERYRKTVKYQYKNRIFRKIQN